MKSHPEFEEKVTAQLKEVMYPEETTESLTA